MKIYTVYLKTSPLGLKYLGMTTKNVLKYNGSGPRWKEHIKRYNYGVFTIHTEILFLSDDQQLANAFALNYSIKKDIVNNIRFANKRNEKGIFSLHISDSLKGTKNLKTSKTVYQYSINGDFIKKWDRIIEPSKIFKCDIYNAVTGRNLESGGFLWRSFYMEKIPPFDRVKNNYGKSKTLLQSDVNTNKIIKQWESTKEAALSLNMHASAIRNCLSVRNSVITAGGFSWRYL